MVVIQGVRTGCTAVQCLLTPRVATDRGIRMYDVIVVGARCAGSATGMLLARRGYRVLIVDRSSFPSDTICTHHLGVAAVAFLARWGLLDRVTTSGCPTADRTLTTIGTSTVEVPNPVLGGLNVSLAPRRSVLDGLLVDAARRAGAEVRERFAVRDLIWDNDRVTGVVGYGEDGHALCYFARWIVGADGRSSLVARSAGVSCLGEQPSTACSYYAYWRGVEHSGPAWLFATDASIGVLPTNDDLACIVVRRPITEWVRFKREPESIYLDQVARFPTLAERMRSASRHGRFVGTAELGGSSRRAWGPGWVLVGDAGRHRDPMGWGGIGEAFWQAERVANALDDGFSSRASIEEGLSAFHRERDESDLTESVGALFSGPWPPAELAGLVSRLQMGTSGPVSRLLASAHS
jgi:flavin-dependent dehydrogenase